MPGMNGLCLRKMFRGLREITADKVLSLHVANLGLIPSTGIEYVPLSMPGVIKEHRARSKH